MSKLSDEYVMQKLVEQQKKQDQKENQDEDEYGRVFIFPTL
jgi:hypothetical protein